jgi:hypothetical protein
VWYWVVSSKRSLCDKIGGEIVLDISPPSLYNEIMIGKGIGMFKVSYMFKDENKLIHDESATFRYMRDAMNFMRMLLASAGLVGKPTIERM